MSDTPRTDACEYVAIRRHAHYDRFAIARELERELAAMQAQRDMLADTLKFIATDKIANAADMRYRAHKALGELEGGDHE